MADNVLYYGDNLEMLRRYIADDSIDLVYLDPPFKSNQDYNVLFAEKDGSQSAAQMRAFKDTWTWDLTSAGAFESVVEAGGKLSETMQGFRSIVGETDMLAYLAMMAPRLVELQRVLKDTGSIYLHCDPTASHYLKLLMDAVFGVKQFGNEVVWRRTNVHNSANAFGKIHDVILRYTKTPDAFFNVVRTPYAKRYIDERFTREDKRGAFDSGDLTGPGIRSGDSGQPWLGFDPTTIGRHWQPPKSLYSQLGEDIKHLSLSGRLDYLLEKGYIIPPAKPGMAPRAKVYVGAGLPLQDIWAFQPYTDGYLPDGGAIDGDVAWLPAGHEERMGFDTQKPEGLLSRIIRASSSEGDTVLDPFCGCGTTVQTAERLKRRWIGMDVTYLAINLIKRRLSDTFELQPKRDYKVIGEPADLAGAVALAAEDPYQFQWWALDLVDARPIEQKKGADRGIDGRLFFHDEQKTGKTKQIIFSVKAGHVSVPHLRDLRGVLDREGAALGVLICMEQPTQPMRTEAASAGFYTSPQWGKKYPRLQIFTIAELLSGRTLDCPPLKKTTFKQAPKAKRRKPEHGALPYAKSGSVPPALAAEAGADEEE